MGVFADTESHRTINIDRLRYPALVNAIRLLARRSVCWAIPGGRCGIQNAATKTQITRLEEPDDLGRCP